MPGPQEAIRPEFGLSENLVFRPRWWWDPVPDWIIQALDRGVLREIAVSQIQVQRTVLEAQLKATDQVLSILSKVR